MSNERGFLEPLKDPEIPMGIQNFTPTTSTVKPDEGLTVLKNQPLHSHECVHCGARGWHHSNDCPKLDD